MLRERGGHLLTDPLKMAKALSGYWGGVMTDNGVSASDCRAFLHELGLPRQWRGAAPKLICTLTEEVVLTALERMHATSSPGLDGVSAAVYQRMPSVFVPQMLCMLRVMCSSGVVPGAWSLAIMNCIPKRPGIPEVAALRPICLQNSVFKWFTGTILLLLEDLISFVTPKEQKAFLKGRSILDHIWGSRGAWDYYTVGAFLTVDFAKAYDSLQHTYMTAFLEYLGVGQALTALLIQLFRARSFLRWGEGWSGRTRFTPGLASGRVTRSRRHCLSFFVPRSSVSHRRSLRFWSSAFMPMTFWCIWRRCHAQLCG